MRSQNKKVAYCFLVSNEGRDFYLLLPFIYYLEKFADFEVHFEFIWDAQKIRKNRPDLVILPNARGQLLYYEVAKYCSENSILVFNHDSEGNFNTDMSYDFWGYNLDKKIYCPLQFTWNQRVKDFLITKYAIPEEKIKITGAPGFDKYRYLPKKSKQEFLEKYNLTNFTKIVGYAGWAFGKLYNEELNDVLNVIDKPGEEGKKWLEEQRDFVEACLETAIQNYPDVLFILKKHPRENFESDFRDSRNEMNQLTKYPNVLYLKDEEEIQDLIQISDLWMAFESTSIMEAWLLDIPTLMINPDQNFKRVDLYQGSIRVRNNEEMKEAFQKLFLEKDLNYFNPDEVIQKRAAIISNSIGFSDGLNHLRCAYYFHPFIDKIKENNTKPTLHFKFLRLSILLHVGKYFYIPWLFKRLPKFKKTVWVFENYSLEKIKESKKEIYPYLDEFYVSQDLPARIQTGDIWKQFD